MSDRGTPEREAVYKKDPEWAERIIAGRDIKESIERRFREHVLPTWRLWARPLRDPEDDYRRGRGKGRW